MASLFTALLLPPQAGDRGQAPLGQPENLPGRVVLRGAAQAVAPALAPGGVHQVGTAQGGQDVLQVLHGDLLPLGNVFQGNVIPGVVVG